MSSADVAQEKLKARELFDRVTKTIELDDARANGHANASSRTSSVLNDDMEMHVEIARLWQEDNVERTTKAFRDASRVSAGSGQVDPRLLNNLGALQHMEGNLDEARTTYEDALTKAATLSAEDGEAMSTSILYNLAKVYEDSGDHAVAKEAYDKLLSRHPEYVDGRSFYDSLENTPLTTQIAKIRQAQMLVNIGQPNEAHELLKQALATQNTNLNLRAFYTSFLLQHNVKVAKDFVFATLKDHERHDVYSLCAAGWILYTQSRDNRDPNPKMIEERKRNFQRAVEAYHKALQLDPLCAVAAQGLAIAVAEDALGILSGVPPVSAADDAQRRMKNSREALDVFAKIRETLNDGSVYVNMGHCYYARDEFDRAIESVSDGSNIVWALSAYLVWVVRNRFRQVLQRSKRACADVSMSILVRQSHQGANVGGHEHRVEIRTDGEDIPFSPDIFLHGEQRSLLDTSPRHSTYNRATRQSCTTLL